MEYEIKGPASYEWYVEMTDGSPSGNFIFGPELSELGENAAGLVYVINYDLRERVGEGYEVEIDNERDCIVIKIGDNGLLGTLRSLTEIYPNFSFRDIRERDANWQKMIQDSSYKGRKGPY